MSKLGPHCILATDAARKWARQASIVKTLDDLKIFEDAPSTAIRVFRHPVAHENDFSDPTRTVNEIIAALKGYRHPNLYLQLWTGGHPPRDILGQAVGLCHNLGYKTLGSSWFTGDYTEADWEDATAADVDAYGPQCYWGDQGFDQYEALRYRSLWKPGQKPVIIPECGKEKIEGGKGGWKLNNITAEQYLKELEDYDAEISKDSYVLGATVFTAGPTPNWDNYSTDELDLSKFQTTASAPASLTIPVIAVAKPTGDKRVRYASGIDLSDDNGQIDWDLLAPCIDFAVIEANDGTYVNKTFGPNWFEAGVHGVARIAYLFCRPSQGSGRDDAMRLLDTLTKNGFNSKDNIAFDLEEKFPTGTDLLAYGLDLKRTLAEHLPGQKPFVYSNVIYLSSHNFLGNAEFADSHLWIANWETASKPDIPADWKDWAMWQYSSKGAIPGVAGNVDLDFFNGTVEQLQALGRP